MLSFPRGSGSTAGGRLDKNAYVRRPYNFMFKGKLVTDEVAAEGLLLQSQDAFSFKEQMLERCKKYNCVDILDTYVADPSELNTEFKARLKASDTPKKAMEDLSEGEKGNIPVARAIDAANLYVFTSADLQTVSCKSVFIG